MISPEILQRYALFNGLEPTFLEDLSSICQHQTIERGKWLFHEGDSAAALYLIVHGSMEIKLKFEEKRNIFVTLSTLHDGDVLGWSAVVDPYIYSLGAVAADDAELLRFDGEPLRRLLEEHADQGYILMGSIAHAAATRVNLLRERVPDLSSRIIISTLLSGLSIATGILVVVFGIAVVLAAANGYKGVAPAIPMVLVCMVVPAALLFFARLIYPSVPRDAPAEEAPDSFTPLDTKPTMEV